VRTESTSGPTARTLLVEFNELSPALLDRFIADGHLPAFAAFRASSVVFTTDAGEDPPALEPWIQWPTVHSGLPYAEHGVFALGDGRRRLTRPLLGDVLSAAGVPVGIFSSMNLSYTRFPGDAGYVVPDPWDVVGRAYPAQLQPFYDAVSTAVQESSRDRLPNPRLAVFLLRNGLRPATVAAALAQLLAERRGADTWRRASVLDAINYDVFRSLNARHRVRFATFFANSTAHYQHYYWRDMEPELFAAPGDGAHAEAVLHGYQAMDALLARIVADHPDALLVLATALSQEPWTDADKRTYRPRDFAALLRFAGVDGVARPMMAEQFRVEPRDTTEAHARLRALLVDGSGVLAVHRDGPDLQAGVRGGGAGTTVTNSRTGEQRSFDELFYAIHTTRSGRHHRDGALWFRTGEHRVEAGRVPLTDIAPTVLAHFGVPQPDHMKGAPLDLRG
jgi:hypothetical protein